MATPGRSANIDTGLMKISAWVVSLANPELAG